MGLGPRTQLYLNNPQVTDLYTPNPAAIVPGTSPAAFVTLANFNTFESQGAVIEFETTGPNPTGVLEWYLVHDGQPEVLQYRDNGTAVAASQAGTARYRTVSLAAVNNVKVPVNFPAFPIGVRIGIAVRWTTDIGPPGASVNIYIYMSDKPLEIPVISTVTGSAAIQGQVASRNAPDPAAVLAATADLPLPTEPDGTLRTRARVLTDEGSFQGYFPGASLYRALTGGAFITMTAGSTAVTGVGTLFATEVRVGDYVEITAQHNDAVPVLVQVQSIESNLALTLRTAWAGATATGAAQVCDWHVLITGAGASIVVAAPFATMTAGTANGGRVTLSRRLGAGGRKGCAPLVERFWLRQNQRLANVQSYFGLTSNLGASAVLQQLAIFNFPMGGTGPDVDCVAARDFAAGLTNSDPVLIPAGGSTDNDPGHLYQVVLREDQAEWYIDGRLRSTGMPVEYAGQTVIPDPYAELYLFVQVENTAVVAAGTNLLVTAVHHRSLNVVDVRPVQPDPDQHCVATFDRTVASGDTPPPPVVSIVTDGVYEITTGARMEKNHSYLVTQLGGADIQVVIGAPGAAAPAIATVRLGARHLFHGIPWVFSPRQSGERLYCGKAVNGTADATVYHESTDGGNGA